MEALSWLVAALVAAFTARRWALVVGACLPARKDREHEQFLPSVLAIVPARDEALRLNGLLDALASLDYPSANLRFALVSDGSCDNTACRFREWSEGRANASAIELHEGKGKAEALNEALRQEAFGEIVVVYDADQRPEPDSLRLLVGGFEDRNVGAASGYLRPANASHSMVSRYAALEKWVHQLVVQAGKARWGWNPPTMGGNCAYRREALNEVGGFPAGSFGEDIEVSLAMIARGWKTRFVKAAVAWNTVGETFRHYSQQRARWTYGMYQARKRAQGVESLFVAAGYADRLAFLAVAALAAAGALSPLWLAVYLSAPAAATVTALAKAGELRRAPQYLACAAPMFAFDVASALTSMAKAVLGLPIPWGRAML